MDVRILALFFLLSDNRLESSMTIKCYDAAVNEQWLQKNLLDKADSFKYG